LFSDCRDPKAVKKVLGFAREHAVASNLMTGSRMMIVGMPNVGKSSMLNALRQAGMQKGKAAKTGAQPGVTRKIGTTVKIAEATSEAEGIYLVDTPGVFVPYVPNAESMLKLALCGSVKDNIIAPEILADYLLYHLNLRDASVYAEYALPTNDIEMLLEAVARKTGRLQKGGVPDVDAAATWLVQRWRTGHLGRFVLDEITMETLHQAREDSEDLDSSVSQARKAQREARRARSKQQKAFAR
jgi:mitochondrial GTPase 1